MIHNPVHYMAQQGKQPATGTVTHLRADRQPQLAPNLQDSPDVVAKYLWQCKLGASGSLLAGPVSASQLRVGSGALQQLLVLEQEAHIAFSAFGKHLQVPKIKKSMFGSQKLFKTAATELCQLTLDNSLTLCGSAVRHSSPQVGSVQQHAVPPQLSACLLAFCLVYGTKKAVACEWPAVLPWRWEGQEQLCQSGLQQHVMSRRAESGSS